MIDFDHEVHGLAGPWLYVCKCCQGNFRFNAGIRVSVSIVQVWLYFEDEKMFTSVADEEILITVEAQALSRLSFKLCRRQRTTRQSGHGGQRTTPHVIWHVRAGGRSGRAA